MKIPINSRKAVYLWAFSTSIFILYCYLGAKSIRYHFDDYSSFIYYQGMFSGQSLYAGDMAKDGDENHLKTMIRLAFAGGSHATSSAMSVLRKSEILKSGYSKGGDPSLASTIDFSKSDAFLMDSMDQMSDGDLASFLSRHAGMFNDEQRKKWVERNSKYSTVDDFEIVSVFNTGLSQENRKKLNACFLKIEGLADSRLFRYFHFDNFGICSEKEEWNKYLDSRYRAIPAFGG